VKLLLDENLSPRLAPRLLSLFSALTHVRDVGLRQADDRAIWDWATANDHLIVTSDSDFVEMSRRLGWPPKIIHIETCDFPFRVIEDMLRRSAVRISAFEKDATAGVFVIRRPG
jgi:predicted nuclease of predicted toxin-antitoxin system